MAPNKTIAVGIIHIELWFRLVFSWVFAERHTFSSQKPQPIQVFRWRCKYEITIFANHLTLSVSIIPRHGPRWYNGPGIYVTAYADAMPKMQKMKRENLWLRSTRRKQIEQIVLHSVNKTCFGLGNNNIVYWLKLQTVSTVVANL